MLRHSTYSTTRYWEARRQALQRRRASVRSARWRMETHNAFRSSRQNFSSKQISASGRIAFGSALGSPWISAGESAAKYWLLSFIPAGSPSVCRRLDFGIVEPNGAVRIAVEVERLRVDFDAVSRRLRKQIAAAADAYWLDKMLVQMIDVLDHAILKALGDADEVERRKMLYIFAETDSARVRTYRNVELCRHEQNREILVHASDAATIYLTDVDCARLE